MAHFLPPAFARETTVLLVCFVLFSVLRALLTFFTRSCVSSTVKEREHGLPNGRAGEFFKKKARDANMKPANNAARLVRLRECTCPSSGITDAAHTFTQLLLPLPPARAACA